MTKQVLVVLLALLVGMTATACGAEDAGAPAGSAQDRISVDGGFGTRPTLDIDEPLELSRSTSWVAAKGSGDAVGANATVILQLTIADGRTGKTVISTFDQGQRPLEVQLNQVFPSLVDALSGKPAGSRVVVASTSDEAYGDQGAPQIGIKGGDPVVMVADVLSTDPTSVLDGPDDTAVTPPAGAPRLQERGGVPTAIDVSGLRKPRQLRVVTLRQGSGPKVTSPDRVTVDYHGVVWGATSPFDESYSKEPATFSVGLGSVIKAWDQGLVGVREGSRVLLICPPGLAYGNTAQSNIPAGSTLVFVVDVLGVG